MNPSYIVILLGNPGNEYIKTRHNAGRIVGEFLVSENFTYQKHFRSYVTMERIGGKNFLFVNPDTYMNESGVVVPLLQKQYDVPIENYIIMYDDLDIMLGDYKLSFDRGSGGHNGIKSLIQHTGTKKFIRIRIGISRTTDDGRMIKPDVLGQFHGSEIDQLKTLVPKISKILDSLGEVGFEMTQSKVGVIGK